MGKSFWCALMSSFYNDAIILSGETGTKLKCDIMGAYYPLWWRITSGGEGKNHRIPTAIVEMDAATSEIHIPETGETILGSAGHSLKLKFGTRNTWNLKIVLIENDKKCYVRLKNVIRRKWPSFPVNQAESLPELNPTKVYLMNRDLEEALDMLDKIDLGLAS